ncbi:MAG: hypothetical protein QM734_02955 [Cyclobacteriaceae bacterium]
MHLHEFLNYFNNDEFFNSFYKNGKYHADTIFDKNQGEIVEGVNDGESLRIYDLNFFARFLIDASFTMKGRFFKELERVVGKLEARKKLEFYSEFINALAEINLGTWISDDRIGPHEKGDHSSNTFYEAKKMLLYLPTYLNKQVESVEKEQESLGIQNLGSLIEWTGPPSKFIELLHTLVARKWAKFPSKSKEKIAQCVLEYVQFDSKPQRSSIVSDLNPDQSAAAEVELQFKDLFDRYQGPYFLGIKENPGLKAVAPKPNAGRKKSKRS